jgi:hypothetical protein
MTSLLYIIIACGGTFGFVSFMKKRPGTQLAHLRAGQLAPRLGMQLAEGDPEFNLGLHSVQPSAQNLGSAKGFLKQVVRSSIGGQLGEFKLRMTGPTAELVLACKQELAKGYAEDVTTTWFDLRLTTRCHAAAAPFDLRLRDERTGLEITRRPDQPRMPVQRFGDTALDQRFVIESTDPDDHHAEGILRDLGFELI